MDLRRVAERLAVRVVAVGLDPIGLGPPLAVEAPEDRLRARVPVLDRRTERELSQARYQYVLGMLRLKLAAGTLSEADLVFINDRLVYAAEPPH